MLRKQSLFAFLVLCFSAIEVSAAAGGGAIQRGGLGFLFPDHNSFANVGQFADNQAMAVEAFYKRTTDATPIQTLTPSFVYGNGMVGLGVYGSRTGTLLTGAGTADSVGAGLGFSLVKGRVTLGLGYDKVLGAANNGTGSATLTLLPPSRRGVSLGVGYRRDITAATNQLTAGLGYSFMSNSNIEADVTFPSLTDFSTWNLGAYFTVSKNMLYLGGGYLMNKTSGGSTSGVAGRLGFVLGRSADISFWTQTFFGTGNVINYGGTFRAMF